MSLRHREYVETMTSSPAEIILKQMGNPGRLKAMIGAKNFMKRGENTLSFDFMSSGKNSPNYVQITLTGRDDYDVEFGRKSKSEYKTIKTYNGVYVDQLKEIFEKQTGLRLSL